MSNYKESNIAGTVWQRCYEVQIFNPRSAMPSVDFLEERVIVLDDGNEIRQSLGPLKVAFDAARLVPVLDPQTGLDTGKQVTYAEAYAILYSAYIAAAIDRDAQIPPPVDPLQGE